MTKRICIGENDQLDKQAARQLYEGDAVEVQVSDLEDFRKEILGLEPNQALAYGITERKRTRLVTKNMLAENAGAVARDREHFSFPAGPAVLMIDYDPP